MTMSHRAGGSSSHRSSTATQADFEHLLAENARLQEEIQQLREENRVLRMQSKPAASHAEGMGGDPSNVSSNCNASQDDRPRRRSSASAWMKRRQGAGAHEDTSVDIDTERVEPAEDEIEGAEANDAEFFLIRFGGKGKSEADSMYDTGRSRAVDEATDEAMEGGSGSDDALAHAMAVSSTQAPVKAFVLSREQKAAAIVAEAAQRKVWEAAQEAPDRIKAKVSEYWATHCGGPGMETLLDASATLVDAQYLIALADAGGVLPRGQAVPEVARITSADAWRLRSWNDPFRLPILVLSCPWLDSNHPDRLGEQLKRVSPLFAAFVAESKKYGPHATVGVLWDYCALPQHPYDDPVADLQRFEAGQRGIHGWYSHPHTFVLMATTLPPVKSSSFIGGSKYTNIRGYSERGWPIVERRLSSLVKSNGRLWDLAKLDSQSVGNFDSLQKQLKAPRLAPMSPKHLEFQLRESVASGEVAFSDPSDLDAALQFYERGCIAALEDFSYNRTSIASKPGELFYRNMSWGELDTDSIQDFLKFAVDRCILPSELIFHLHQGNTFSDPAKARMRAVCEGSKIRVEE